MIELALGINFPIVCINQISGAVCNTNMYLEAFHRVLKDIYMDKKKNRRVDSLLYILMELVNDRVFDRLRMVEKQASSYCLNEIRRRHKTAAADFDKFTLVEHNGYTVVKSQQKLYCVVLASGTNCDCLLR